MRAEEIRRNIVFVLLMLLLILLISMFLFAIFGDNEVYDYILDTKFGGMINDFIIRVISYGKENI